MIRKAVVPVAGLGTRMMPLTRSMPKEMLPLGRKPAIHRVVDELAAAGVERIHFVTSSQKKAIEDYFEPGGRSERPCDARKSPGSGEEDGPPALDYSFVRQEKPAGNGDAVLRGKAFAGPDPFVVAWGDAVIRSTARDSLLRRMMETHEKQDAACTIAVEYVPEDRVSRYGIVRPRYTSDSAFPIDDIVEKPAVENTPSRYAVSARYICGPDVFPALERTMPGKNGELWLADAIRGLIRKGDPVWCVPLGSTNRRYDIGTPLTYWEAFVDYALENETDGTAFRDLLRERLNES